MSAVTAEVEPALRVTVTEALWTMPAGIVSVVSPSISPLTTLTGNVRANGAAVGATALNRPRPAGSRDTATGRGSTALPSSSRVSSAVRPENAPSGSELRSLAYR